MTSSGNSSNCRHGCRPARLRAPSPPNRSTDITFTVSSCNAIGRYFATISARTTLRQSSSNTLDTPIDISVNIQGEKPHWDAESYPESMMVLGQICIDGILSTDTEDMVGAFMNDGGEMKCVGSAQPKYDSTRDAYYVRIMVKGKREMADAPVSFRIYDASSGKIYPLVSTTPAVTFAVDGSTGDYKNPVIWKNENKLLQTEPLDEGWTSISLYLNPDTKDQHLFDVLGSHIDEVDMDKTTALTYKDGQWSDSYTPIKPGQMMKVCLNEADTLQVIGDEVNPADWPQTIAPNASTWIGVPTQASMGADEAFAGVEPLEGDMVKNDDGAIVFDGNVWVGDFEIILPGRGYVYYSGADTPKQLVFPDKSGSGLTCYHSQRRGLPASRKYAHSMVALCTVHTTPAPSSTIWTFRCSTCLASCAENPSRCCATRCTWYSSAARPRASHSSSWLTTTDRLTFSRCRRDSSAMAYWAVS